MTAPSHDKNQVENCNSSMTCLSVKSDKEKTPDKLFLCPLWRRLNTWFHRQTREKGCRKKLFYLEKALNLTGPPLKLLLF